MCADVSVCKYYLSLPDDSLLGGDEKSVSAY